MGMFQNWARKRMTQGALAARERGDTTYVHRLASSDQRIQNRYTSVIESEGWQLAGVHEDSSRPEERWVMTFKRAGEAGGTATRSAERA
ncbi:hypothetical protein J2X68_003201 [Streptomyces sp. 3330]|uniref:hypothetical protein n=1 Tax=Streptomyces sp. 3330 TaxID=2817755 RepID=UPI002860F195|nr:hypothetical protein [Streptomyces sp. 3330]MDR6976510.1 hypothetical protein [Streptomyces sp. 3330]